MSQTNASRLDGPRRPPHHANRAESPRRPTGERVVQQGVDVASDNQFGIPGVPFPVGVEYYRAPVPKPELWDEDFARIRAGGMRIIRTFNYWNHLEPRPGQYETDDIDLLFELAHKHDLRMWLDLPLATHGACPEWLTREHPDMRVVSYRNHVSLTSASPAYPQGSQIHCYDHPAWREYGEKLLRHMIGRYKDHPALLVWGLWDGIALSAAWSKTSDGLPCYCPSTLARYDAWLKERFTLDELNASVHRRYRRWEDVQPPRSNQNVVEMLLYKQFHYENLAGHLQWVMDVANDVDPVHEKRSHGAWYPRPQDTACAPVADSWGMSMSSNNLLTSEDPYKLSERAFGYDWSRSIGKNGRWWNEEIYSGMSRGGVTWRKQSAPEEPTMLLWMCLASGGAGAMYWQYRPEYFSFESPGYNLIALDGQPTARWQSTTEALCQMAGMEGHLPLRCGTADVAVVYHGESQELFSYNDEDDRYLDDMRGVHRTLWANGIPVDIVSPGMDWSPYRLIYLTNAALMTDELRQRIEQTLDANPNVQIVADGSFGLYSARRAIVLCTPGGILRAIRRACGGLQRHYRAGHRGRSKRAPGAGWRHPHQHPVRLCRPRAQERRNRRRLARGRDGGRAQRQRAVHLVGSVVVGGLRRRRPPGPGTPRRAGGFHRSAAVD